MKLANPLPNISLTSHHLHRKHLHKQTKATLKLSLNSAQENFRYNSEHQHNKYEANNDQWSMNKLLLMSKDFVSSSVYSRFRVILHSFWQIRFDHQTIVAWVMTNEIGAVTTKAIVTGKVDENC